MSKNGVDDVGEVAGVVVGVVYGAVDGVFVTAGCVSILVRIESASSCNAWFFSINRALSAFIASQSPCAVEC
jgi:hypothetical protein